MLPSIRCSPMPSLGARVRTSPPNAGTRRCGAARCSRLAAVGPGHAAEIARVLGIGTVVIPPYAGLFAALGMLWSPPERRVSQAVKIRLDGRRGGRARYRAGRPARDRRSRCLSVASRSAREEVDVHYVGQLPRSYNSTRTPRRDNQSRRCAPGLRSQHERTYGHASPSENCESPIRTPDPALRRGGASTQ